MMRFLSSFGVFFLLLLLSPSNVAEAQSANADPFKHAAPEKCVAYMMWNADKAPPIDGNKTQSLMAEPDVRAFVDDLKLRAGLLAPAMVSESNMPKLKRELLHWVSPKFVDAIVNHSGCMFIEELVVARGGEQPPTVKAAILLQPQGDIDRFVKRLSEVMKTTEEKSQMVTLAQTEARRLPVDGYPSDLFFGNANGTCVIALGKDAYVGAVERMKAGKTPQWLVDLDQQASQLKHVYALGYIDSKSIMRSIRGAFGARSILFADLLGVGNIESIKMISGLNEVDSSIHLLAKTKQPEGVLGLFTRRPINETLVQQFPADSVIASAMTVDAEEVLEWVETAELLMGGQGDWGRIQNAIEREVGIGVEEDVLAHLGTSWGLYNGAADGWLTGMTLVGEAKNVQKLSETLELFFKTAGEKTREIPNRYRPKFYKQKYNGVTIYSMQQPDLWAEPSFCVKDNRFYVAAYPQAIMSAVSDSTETPVLFDKTKLAKIQQSMFLGDSAKLTALAYADSRAQAQLGYPWIQVIKSGLQSIYGPAETSNAQALLEGMQLPPARTVIRHLEPAVTCLRVSDEGVEVEIRQTIPTNTVAVTMPVAVGVLLPSVGGVKNAARSAQSMNNLRQQALACLNYESAYMRFPCDGPIARGDEDKEHEFSWRVHILPFIEQNNLYQQIHFDEPWDSEHNKTLHDQMPLVYRAPNSKAAAGMTVYRGFGGDSGILANDDGQRIGFGQIVDGSSNTILVMQVDDEMATPWMKPDCLDPDEAQVEEIFGKHKLTNSAFCDGSVHRIPATIDPEVLKHLLERDDGNVVSVAELQDRRGNRNKPAADADPRFVVPGPKERF